VLSLDHQRGTHDGIVTLMSLCCNNSTISKRRYPRHRFPIGVISQCDWLYVCYSLGDRDIELGMAERGLTVGYGTVRLGCDQVEREYSTRLCRCRGPVEDTWYLDEVYLKTNGQFQYLWRAVDQKGQVIGILVQNRRDPIYGRAIPSTAFTYPTPASFSTCPV